MLAAGFLGALIATSWFNDDRVVIEDHIVGADFEITHVDGLPVERREHGWIVTKVPYALANPGKRLLTVTDTDASSDSEASAKEYTMETEILKGVRYRIERDKDGQPNLLVIAH